MFTLASVSTTLLAVVFVLVCVFMILVVLIQKPKGGGLSGAFGGAGGGPQGGVFGAKVGDVLTWTTVTCFVIFLLLAVAMTFLINSEVAVVEPAPPTVEPISDDLGDLPIRPLNTEAPPVTPAPPETLPAETAPPADPAPPAPAPAPTPPAAAPVPPTEPAP